MTAYELFIFLIIGAVAGWLSSLLTRGRGRGLVMNVIMGCIGAIVGHFVFDALSIRFDNQLMGQIVSATTGAVIVVMIARILK